MKTIKDLKAMIAEPASKEWFAKHGSPKQAVAKKMHKKKENHLFENVDKTIKRIKSGYDSRYGN